MNIIKVGIIGFGMMGRMQAEGCFGTLANRYRIVGICDDYEPHLEDARRLFRSGDVKFYRDYRQMLEECDFDLAAIVTPDHLHEEMALACLRNGKHLRLEKPMALDPAGCRRVAEEAARSGTTVQIGLELRYSELTARMKNELPGLGRLKMLWCHEFRHPFLEKRGSLPDWIIRKRYSGGTLVEKCCHHFDLFNAFAGAKPLSVFASGDHDVEYPHTDVLDNAFVTVDYTNGVRANLSLCIVAPRSAEGTRLPSLEFGALGSNGRMEMRDDSLVVKNRSTGLESAWEHERSDMVGHNDEITPSLVDLADSIRFRRRPESDVKAGFNSILVACAAELSAAERRIVTIEEMEKHYDAPWMA